MAASVRSRAPLPRAGRVLFTPAPLLVVAVPRTGRWDATLSAGRWQATIPSRQGA